MTTPFPLKPPAPRPLCAALWLLCVPLAAAGPPPIALDNAGEPNRNLGVAFEQLERSELAWGLVPRSATQRERFSVEPEETFLHDPIGEIDATVLSLPSSAFALDEVLPFLEALLALDSSRVVLAISDGPLARALARLAASHPRLTVIDSHRAVYSPWPRDAILFRRDRRGGVEILVRPDRQRGREHDSELALELIQNLPSDLDREWRQPRWSRAPVTFHNGQLLPDDRSLWISLHSVEPRVLELLAESVVPVESFRSTVGVERYLAAARRAALELEPLFGRPVRFVHPLPSNGSPAQRADAMRGLGAGAGIDLDSLLTILPRPTTRVALVGSFARGQSLLETAEVLELDRLADLYALPRRIRESGIEALRDALLDPLRTAHTIARESFLDSVAHHLESEGLEVRRTPLLLLPGALVKVPSGPDPPPDALLGWNNVVIEVTPSASVGLRAEGFASGVPSWDEQAIAVYESAGYRLELLPPLVRSVLYNGGYRCASNHLRDSTSPRH